MDYTAILHRIKSFIESLPKQEPAKPLRLIVGLSGGPDSVFLLRSLKSLAAEQPLELIAAHLDHGWRDNSADDVAFCSALCTALGIPFIHGHADTYKGQVLFNGSQEAYGRALRRLFFDNSRALYQADFIILGHHQQDQHETFFLRLLRGTSLDGLTCIKPHDRLYLRPLLSITKKQIVSFLEHHKIPYLTDPTNASTDHLRNSIRHNVIPALVSCDQRFAQKLDDTIANLTAENEFITECAEKAFGDIFRKDTEKGWIGEIKKFRALHPVLQKRILISWLTKEAVSFSPSRGYLEEIVRFLDSNRGGCHTIGPNVTIIKKGQLVWLAFL